MTSLRLLVSSCLVLSLAAAGCGDSSSPKGAGGSLGHGGAVGTGGRAATGGAGGGVAAGGTTGARTGGTVGAGGAAGARTGGTVGAGGATGQGGTGPVDAAVDRPSSLDVAIDSATPDATDVPIGNIDAGASFAQIKELIATRCAGCHTGAGSAATRLDFTDNPDAATTLYSRLVGPLLLEIYCGENIDAGNGAVARHAIVPGDLASSFLYLKINGTQPSPGNPPANCGSRMPRVLVPGVDGGAPSFPGCDTLDGGAAANCLSPADIDLVRRWILENAPP